MQSRTICLLGCVLLVLSGCAPSSEQKSEKTLLPDLKLVDKFYNRGAVQANAADVTSKSGAVSGKGAARKPRQPDFRTKTKYPGLAADLISGRKFKLDLDKCEFDDKGWTGKSDPLGRLECGQSYVLEFEARSNTWISRGRDEYLEHSGRESMVENRKAGGPPLGNAVYVWGVRFVISEDGTAYTRDGKLAGTLRPQ